MVILIDFSKIDSRVINYLKKRRAEQKINVNTFNLLLDVFEEIPVPCGDIIDCSKRCKDYLEIFKKIKSNYQNNKLWLTIAKIQFIVATKNGIPKEESDSAQKELAIILQNFV